MRVSELLRKLDEQDSLKPLVSAGVVSTTVLNYFHIAERLEEKSKKSKRANKMRIITEVAHEFKVEQTTIYRAKAFMNKKVNSNFATNGKNNKPNNP